MVIGSPPSKSHGVRPFGMGTLPNLGDLLTMVINDLLVRMIPSMGTTAPVSIAAAIQLGN